MQSLPPTITTLIFDACLSEIFWLAIANFLAPVYHKREGLSRGNKKTASGEPEAVITVILYLLVHAQNYLQAYLQIDPGR